MSIVLDASAMLALLRGERGGDLVQEWLDEADVPIYAHTINLLEVFYFIARRGGVSAGREAVADLRAWGVIERRDLDAQFVEDAGALKAAWNCALGDCFGVAPARRLDADFATADHPEIEPMEAAGACAVTFIR